MKLYVSTVIEKDGYFILVRENKKQCYGKWNIPSGHLEDDEFITWAAVREVKEETNLDVELTGLVVIYNNMYEDSNSISFVFGGNIIQEKEIVFDNNEIIETKWFTFEELLNMKEELRDYDYIIEAISRYRENDIKSLDTIKIRGDIPKKKLRLVPDDNGKN